MARLARMSCSDIAGLENAIERVQCQCVLFAAYSEYFSPLWAHRLRRLHRRGIRFGVITHDPVRDFQVGPYLWHQYSISQAYSFVDVAFVHQAERFDRGWPVTEVPTVTIPHGPYRFPEGDSTSNQAQLKAHFGIPAKATVLLAFGHIRDGKNLNHIIQCLPGLLNCYLLVAGKEQSSSQRPVKYYQELAESLGVSDRCRWHHQHINCDDVWMYFCASDIVLLTYSKEFQSASGVLCTASQFRRRVVGSSGGGPLCGLIERYQLGQACPPDSQPALLAAIQRELTHPSTPDWAAHDTDNSWKRNAEICIDRLLPER